MVAIKAPVFSFPEARAKVEPSLGPEMKSTGEILGIDRTFAGALYKAMVASGIGFKGEGDVLLTVQATGDKPNGGRHRAGAARAGKVACRDARHGGGPARGGAAVPRKS